MTSTLAPTAPPARYTSSPWVFLQTFLHLIALGVIGPVVAASILGFFGFGVGFFLLAGLGIILLIAGIFIAFGVGWLETERVRGLYGLDVSPLRWTPRQGLGVRATVNNIWSNFTQGRLWASLGSFALATVLGTLLVSVIGWTVGALRRAIFPRSAGQGLALPFLQISSNDSGWYFLGAFILLLVAIGIVWVHRPSCGSIIAAAAKSEQLEHQVAVTSKQREGAVRAAEVERNRIERDLHDGVQPRLVSIGMTLGLAQQKIADDPEGANALIHEAHASTKAAITELRQLTRGIYASVLEDRGLDAALSAIAARSHIPVQLDVQLPHACERTSEAAMYFAIAESLTNAVKHSRATKAQVSVRLLRQNQRHELWSRIEDNGIGGASIIPGGGLDGVANRVSAAGGTLSVISPDGGPTVIEVQVPCAS